MEVEIVKFSILVGVVLWLFLSRETDRMKNIRNVILRIFKLRYRGLGGFCEVIGRNGRQVWGIVVNSNLELYPGKDVAMPRWWVSLERENFANSILLCEVVQQILFPYRYVDFSAEIDRN